jgi:hypothetical protein
MEPYAGETTEFNIDDKKITVITRRHTPYGFLITSIKPANGQEHIFTRHINPRMAIEAHGRFCRRVPQFMTDWQEYFRDECRFVEEQNKKFIEGEKKKWDEEDMEEGQGKVPRLSDERRDAINNFFIFGNMWKMYEEKMSIRYFTLEHAFEDFVHKTEFLATADDQRKFVEGYRKQTEIPNGLHQILVFTSPDIRAIQDRKEKYICTYVCIKTRGSFVRVVDYASNEEAKIGHLKVCQAVPKLKGAFDAYYDEVKEGVKSEYDGLIKTRKRNWRWGLLIAGSIALFVKKLKL